MRISIITWLAASLPFAVPAASPAQGTIADIVIAASGGASAGTFDHNGRDYDLLVRALTAANLVGALDNPASNLTVFAPSDDSFVRLARDLGFRGRDEAGAWTFLVDTLTALGNGDPIPTLTNILLYHVVGGRVNARDLIVKTLRRERIQTLLTGATIRPFFLTLRDNEPDLRDPVVTMPVNLRASNGLVHGVTRVLIPVDLP